MTMQRWLAEGSAFLGVVLTSSVEQTLLNYLILLNKWNRAINLTGTRDKRSLVLYHVVDCLSIIPHLPDGPIRLLDVGAGAGLPAAIIAIARSNIQVTALEPISRKHAFLATVRRKLELENFHPLNLHLKSHSEASNFHLYDVATSRATFSVPEWLVLGQSVVRTGGLVLAMEGLQQNDLPDGATRHEYSIGDRTRAIITYSKASGSPTLGSLGPSS